MYWRASFVILILRETERGSREASPSGLQRVEAPPGALGSNAEALALV